MAIGNRPKLTLGLTKNLDNSQSQNEENSQTRTEKHSKLTLGLKKKPSEATPAQDDSQMTTEKRTKLTLGLRKKSQGLRSQSESEGSAIDKRSKLSLGLRKRQEIFRPQSVEREKSQQAFTFKKTIANTKVNNTPGKLEVNIKISELPNWVETIKRGWYQFCVNAEGQIVQMKVRPRTWNKLLKANDEYPMWVASITGKMGYRIKDGFELLEPSIQIYEKQPLQEDSGESPVEE